MNKLPDTLSDLLEMAVKDCQTVTAKDGYVEDMSVWHDPREDGTCHVCMAGSVMSQQMALPVTQQVRTNNIDDLPKDVAHKLFAIDLMRVGDMVGAYRMAVSRDAVIKDKVSEALSAANYLIAENRREMTSLDVEKDPKTRYAPRADWGTYLEAVAVLREAGL